MRFVKHNGEFLIAECKLDQTFRFCIWCKLSIVRGDYFPCGNCLIHKSTISRYLSRDSEEVILISGTFLWLDGEEEI